ncbi:MAG: TIR domain-containing protein [Bacteroidales bacterium]|nr:TIR domain-containing protein [Bacteroidales bacterium]
MDDKNQAKPMNYVFISYNHKDVKWAKWLQRKLEWYRLPTEAHNELSDSRYIRPVFRDRDTLTSGILNDSLRAHLEASRYLVVICSPNSADSAWVNDEIKAFIEMGRLEQIVPFVVEGISFPPALEQWNREHPDKCLLGISVTDDGNTDPEKAFIRLVAHILGLQFDTLWHRHRRFVRRLAVAAAALAVVLAALAYWFMVPVKLQVSVRSEACLLPEMEAGTLTVNGSEYPLTRPDTTVSAGALPGYFRLRTIPVSFHADRYYDDETLLVPLGAGIRSLATMQVHRDSTFAVFAGKVYDGSAADFLTNPVPGVQVTVGDRTAVTDGDGSFRIVFPLEEQSETKPLILGKEGFQPLFREDESPSEDLIYLLDPTVA